MKNGQWMCNFDGGDYWTDGKYLDTRELAIDYGKERIKQINKNEGYKYCNSEEPLTAFVVGQLSVHLPFIDAENVIETLIDQANDECGEFAESFLDSVDDSQSNRLSDLLNEAMGKWLEETNNQVDFFTISDSETIIC